jgi:uncharacterized protein with HEPN domain
MPRDARDLLNDVRAAVEMIEQFVTGRGLPDYTADSLLRSAVERQFIVIGEALGQLERLDAAVVAPITDYRKVVAFRNILVHGYSTIDDRVVWTVIQQNLPLLRNQIETVLSSLGTP